MKMKVNLSNLRLKPQRGLTTREFIMLALLVVALEGYFLVNYILAPAYDDYASAVRELQERQQALDDIKRDYARQNEIEAEIKDAEGKLAVIQAQLPPYVSQEEAVFSLKDYSDRSGLSIKSISFVNAGELPLSVVPAGGTEDKAPFTAPVPVLAEQQVTINFMGDYRQVYDFLSNVETNSRKGSLKSITLQKNDDGTLNGVMTLSFPSYWDEYEGRKPFVMTPESESGKASLFDEYTGYSTSGQARSEALKPAPRPDFYITLNSYLNNSAKVFMMNYYNAGSEAIEDRNETVTAQMTLNGADGKYTFSYKLGAYDIVGDTPTEIKDGKIRMEVLVQPRRSDEDRVGLVLDITNNTGVPFEITVKGDDPSNPRFMTGRTVGNVMVIQANG